MIARGRFGDLLADRLDRRIGCDIDGEIRRSRVREISQHRLTIHQDAAALAAVIVINIDDAKSLTHGSKRNRDGVASAHMMFIGEWLADHDSIGIANLRENLLGWPAREKVRAVIRRS